MFGVGGLYSSTALGNIDPNSFSGRIFHASHYGPFEAVVRDGQIVGINSDPELDAQPTEMLSFGIVNRTYDKTRIDYPMVRKSYLESWQSGDTKPALRGKIERWHQTLKNRILLENYYLPGALEQAIGDFIDHYNHHRYHESLGNMTPADVHFGRAETILRRRMEIKTIQKRRLLHRQNAA